MLGISIHKKEINPKYKYSYLLGKSTKIDKSDKYSEYNNLIMYLAPHLESGYNMCPYATPGCSSACLYTAGRGKYSNIKQARINRTLHYVKDRKGFEERLFAEISYHFRLSHGKLAIRLNGTSDINWIPFIKKVHKTYPSVVFYDYTKNPKIAISAKEVDNYFVTFSRSEENHLQCLDMLDSGVNVAVVFRNQLPLSFMRHEVIDGDISDTRFLDSQGVVVGLRAKGKAKVETTGFVLD